LLAGAISIYSASYSQNKIPVDSVSKHIGETIMAC